MQQQSFDELSGWVKEVLATAFDRIDVPISEGDWSLGISFVIF